MRNSPAKRLAAAATNQQAARTCAGALGTLAYLFECASRAHPYRGCDGASGWHNAASNALPHMGAGVGGWND